MLSPKQIEYALSLKTYDTFFDEVADLSVHIAHDEHGMYFCIMDSDGSVYESLSTFLPYLWIAAANARLWPRDGRGPVAYFTQMRINKIGDKYYTKRGPCTVKDEGRIDWKVDIRALQDIFFNQQEKK